MIVYGIIFVLFCINAFFNNDEKKVKKINLGIYVLFILIYSIRKEVGTDWTFYKDYFDNFFSPGKVEEYGFEYGYMLLNYGTRLLFDSYWILVFIVGIFNGILFWKATNAYTKNISIIMLLSLYFFFYPSIESFRQSISIVLFYYSLGYIEQDKRKYIAINIIGFMFHRSSIIALLFFAFNNYRAIRITVTAVLLSFNIIDMIVLKIDDVFPAFVVKIAELLPAISGKYDYYFIKQRTSNPILTIKLLEYALILLMYFIINKKDTLNTKEKILSKLILLGFLLQVSIAQITNITYRFTYYTDMGVMLTLTLMFDKLWSPKYKKLYIIGLILYTFVRLYRIFPFDDYRFFYNF